MVRRRVAIIGAGPAGLPSIRHALLYGCEPVCYEQQEDLGGLWRFKPNETEASSVMKSTIINTSKEMTAYSDFPPPPTEANFMHNTRVLEYFRAYAKAHDLLRHIHFNTKVVNIERTKDHDETGQWNVTVRDGDGGTHTEVFDGVMVCVGHHAKPNMPPRFIGQERFQGEIIHSHSYKHHKGYEDKTVVVVGIGNSACDIAVELSKIAKQVYLASRRGAWVFNRVYDNGLPKDVSLNTRWNRLFINYLPSSYNEWAAKKKLNSRFNHELYGLQPNHAVFATHPTVNDDLPNRIAAGTIKLRPPIASFTERGVMFNDNTSVEHADSVIFSTGYTYSFDFLEDGKLIEVKENSVDLYQYMYPLNLEHDTLAVIGLVQPLGSTMPVAEMQARLFLDALTGNTVLPSKRQREESVRQRKKLMAARYLHSPRHTIQIDCIPYMDGLADLLGCRPSLWHFFLSDPLLGYTLLMGPAVAYQYRLVGPHPWKNARAAILSVEERIVQATNSKLKKYPDFGSVSFEVIVMFASIFICLFLLLP